ncbi:Membrane metallo-endopeptidase-like 1 [Tyrophagus putrescentiae]|nr:Membrane metallo-endopeptidase-like 1 [Tyrophagus putrescentiae]
MEVCTTDACNQTALFLLNSLDASVNPCEDFYGFACGGWERRHQTLPDNVSYIDEWTKLRQDKVVPAMRALFEAPQLTTPTNAHTVVLAQLLYNYCVNQTSRDSAGWTPLVRQLHYLLGFKWPQKNGTDYPGYSLEATIARFAAVDVQPLVSLFPVLDKLNTSRRIMIFGLPRYVFANHSKHSDQYDTHKNTSHNLMRTFSFLNSKKQNVS